MAVVRNCEGPQEEGEEDCSKHLKVIFGHRCTKNRETTSNRYTQRFSRQSTKNPNPVKTEFIFACAALPGGKLHAKGITAEVKPNGPAAKSRNWILQNSTESIYLGSMRN